MTENPSYSRALFYAVSLHLFLVGLLITESWQQRPVLKAEVKNTRTELSQDQAKKEIVKAVSLDNKVVEETVKRLRAEKMQKQQQEVQRQQKLAQQALQAKQARIKEQQQLAKLKEEADRIAIARKKQMEEEKKRLKQLAEEKIRETKRLAELKKQQEVLKKEEELHKKKMAEEQRLAALKKKEAEDKAKAEQLRAEETRRKEAAIRQAALDREKEARIAGEVDKYKALIINAISRQWILPDNADPGLSSQFRIRLAPDGTVLDVNLTRSSGDSVLDRSAQNAIYKASPLPVPGDPDTFNIFREISLTVRPEQVRG